MPVRRHKVKMEVGVEKTNDPREGGNPHPAPPTATLEALPRPLW